MRLALAVLVAMTASAVAKPRWQQLVLPPAMPAPIDQGFVDSDGAKIYYARYSDKGAPVVLLHGGMGNGDHWAHQVPALADKLQVIAIDSRGQGRSTRTKTSPTYDLMAKDVLAVLDHLKLDKASFVGWSDGGEIALKLAIQQPARVDKIFVIGANYDARGSKRSKRSSPFDIYTAKCRADYEKMSKTPTQWNAMLSWLTPLWRKPMGFTKDQLRSIGAPALVAGADHDELIVLGQLQEMAKLIPGARFVVFKDVSHFVLWQDPTGFNQVLVGFLTAH